MQALGQAKVVLDQLLLFPKKTLLQHGDLRREGAATDRSPGEKGEKLLPRIQRLFQEGYRILVVCEESVARPDQGNVQGTDFQGDPPTYPHTDPSPHHHAFPNLDRQTCSWDSRTVWLKMVQFTV